MVEADHAIATVGRPAEANSNVLHLVSVERKIARAGLVGRGEEVHDALVRDERTDVAEHAIAEAPSLQRRRIIARRGNDARSVVPVRHAIQILEPSGAARSRREHQDVDGDRREEGIVGGWHGAAQERNTWTEPNSSDQSLQFQNHITVRFEFFADLLMSRLPCCLRGEG